MAGVETSDMYIGTIIVSMPTENPAIARPAVKSQIDGSVSTHVLLTTYQQTA